MKASRATASSTCAARNQAYTPDVSVTVAAPCGTGVGVSTGVAVSVGSGVSVGVDVSVGVVVGPGAPGAMVLWSTSLQSGGAAWPPSSVIRNSACRLALYVAA